MIPVPTLVAEVITGLGAALAGANAAVLLRPWWEKRRSGRIAPRPASMGRVIMNLGIGLVVMSLGIASLVRGATG